MTLEGGDCALNYLERVLRLTSYATRVYLSADAHIKAMGELDSAKTAYDNLPAGKSDTEIDAIRVAKRTIYDKKTLKAESFSAYDRDVEDFRRFRKTIETDTSDFTKQYRAMIEKDRTTSDLLAARDKSLSDITETLAARDKSISDITETLAARDKSISDITETLAARDKTISDLETALNKMTSDWMQAAIDVQGIFNKPLVGVALSSKRRGPFSDSYPKPKRTAAHVQQPTTVPVPEPDTEIQSVDPAPQPDTEIESVDPAPEPDTEIDSDSDTEEPEDNTHLDDLPWENSTESFEADWVRDNPHEAEWLKEMNETHDCYNINFEARNHVKLFKACPGCVICNHPKAKSFVKH